MRLSSVSNPQPHIARYTARLPIGGLASPIGSQPYSNRHGFARSQRRQVALSFKVNDLEYHEVTLDNGNKCRIGRPKGSAEAEENANEQAEAEKIEAEKDGLLRSHGPELHYELPSKWSPGSFPAPSGETQEATGITYQRVTGPVESTLNHPRFYSCDLNFWTNQSYNYYFKDATGIWVQCNCFLKGDHNVSWDSSDPTIVQVDGY